MNIKKLSTPQNGGERSFFSGERIDLFVKRKIKPIGMNRGEGLLTINYEDFFILKTVNGE